MKNSRTPHIRFLLIGMIIFFSSFLTIYTDAQTANTEGAIVREIKFSGGSDKDIKVTITIYPEKINDFEKGYQRLTETIPDGFTAKTESSTTASVDTKENQLRFYWMNGRMPEKGPVTVSYCLHKSGTEKIKNIVIDGTFKYSVKNENREVIISGDNTFALK